MKKYDFVVLGATGLQGKIAAKDLLKSGYSVLLMGRDKKGIDDLLEFKKTGFELFDAANVEDLTRKLRRSKSKIAVNCVEGDWNLNILKACLDAGLSCLDLDAPIPMTKKQLAMDSILKKRNLISITGCGSVPGTGNVMLRYVADKFDTITKIEEGFAWKSNMEKFVLPFSIESIIEEFTTPASVLRNGKIIKKIPLENMRKKYHRGIGIAREFLSEHAELCTFPYYYKKKGLRNIKFYAGFPEHSFRVIMSLIDTGFGEKKKTAHIHDIKKKISPLTVLTEVLRDVKVPEGYKEVENLWLKVIGKKDGINKIILIECLVPTLKGWEDAYTNIDTGMPISIMAQMVKNGIIKEKGSFAPEAVVPPIPYFKELRKRSMVIYENGEVIN